MSGVGLDVGTMNLVVARQTDTGVSTTRMRDAFLDLPTTSKKLLKLSKASFVERGDELLILGDSALEMALMFGREVRRPLQKGLVSSQEMEAIEVVGYMIQSLLGEPRTEGEVCFYSIPAAPVDNPNRDIIYHKRLFERIVADCGYRPVAGNEAMAIIFAEAAKENFSGLALSFGSGMTNIAMGNLAIECMAFSVEVGGDWIDQGAARSIGSTASQCCAAKESGMDLLSPQNRIEEALSFYYKELIEYVLTQVGSEFKKRKLQLVFGKPLPVIISGGTSLCKNFLPFFEQVLKNQKLPFAVSEVRQASDPLNAVAQGLLIQALQESEED